MYTDHRSGNSKRLPRAIKILRLNVQEHPAFFGNYNLLKTLLLTGDTNAAITNYRLSTLKYTDTTEDEAFKELPRLQNHPGDSAK